jgi:DNA-binding protein HU-beta
MNSKELITTLSKQMGWTISEINEVMMALGTTLGERLTDNDSVSIPGFGQFEVKKKEERITVNPANGKRYLVPPKLSPTFKSGATLKNRIKSLDENE